MILYHLTYADYVPSIMTEGLKPMLGWHVRRCIHRWERLSGDRRISLCQEKDIDYWKKALFQNEGDIDIVVLKVDTKGLDLKYRIWNNTVKEFGCWSMIEPNRIEITRL